MAWLPGLEAYASSTPRGSFESEEWCTSRWHLGLNGLSIHHRDDHRTDLSEVHTTERRDAVALESLDAVNWLRKHLEQDDSEPRAKSAPHRLSSPCRPLCERIVPLRARVTMMRCSSLMAW